MLAQIAELPFDVALSDDAVAHGDGDAIDDLGARGEGEEEEEEEKYLS